jgi:hypothetical protein
MKKKILTLLTLSLFAYSSQYNPDNITQQEYQTIVNIDKNIYEIYTQKDSFSINEIADFIFTHLSYNPNYSKVRILSSISANSSTSNIQSQTGYEVDKTSLNANITLSYPILDKAEELKRRKESLSIKKEIIKDVKEYLSIKVDINALKSKLKVLKQLEVRAKARKLDGVGGFNDWLSILENINKTNSDITQKELELQEAKELLITAVEPNSIQSLEKML